MEDWSDVKPQESISVCNHAKDCQWTKDIKTWFLKHVATPFTFGSSLNASVKEVF